MILKIDDPALQHALKKKFYYIGALGSKKTHANRCERLKESGFNEDEINSIHGPVGIKLGGKSASRNSSINNCTISFGDL